MASYRKLLESLLSWHYYERGVFGDEGRGEDFLNMLGDKVDEIQDWWKSGTIASFVKKGPDEALPYILQNYNLDQPEQFVPAQARAMALDAWNIWERSGSHEGILTEVRRLGYPNCQIIPVWQFKRSQRVGQDEIQCRPTLPREFDHNIRFWPRSVTGRLLPPFGTDKPFGDNWWKEEQPDGNGPINFHFTCFWLVINPPHPFSFLRWGDPVRYGQGYRWSGLVKGDLSYLRRLFLTVKKHTPGEWSCRGVIFTYPGKHKPVAERMFSVWTWASFEAWACGDNGVILHWDGNTWTPVVNSGTTQQLLSIWGRSPTDIWAVGAGGTIVHYDGTKWTLQPSGTAATLTGVAGAGAVVWACGDGGVMVRHNGFVWQLQANVVNTALNEIFALGVNDVWMVGDNGTAIHFDGITWASINTGSAANLTGIWGPNTTEIWAVGSQGTILKWDGAAWNAVASPTSRWVQSVWGTKDGKALAATRLPALPPQTGSELLHYNGAQWVVADPNVTGGAMRGVHGTQAKFFWAVGDSGLFWCSVEGKVYWSLPWGQFNWGDGSRYNLNYVIKRLREPWE